MINAKIIVLRTIVFILVFTGVVIVINYFINENLFYVAYDAGANIKVWLDINRNGKQENNEPFVPNVCVWSGYAYSFQSLGSWQKICSNQYFYTDSSGTWSDFFAGGSCQEIYIAINPPENYFPTTPTIVNGCSAEFGLSQEKPAFEIKSQDIGSYLEEEYQKEITITRVKFGIAVLLIFIFAGLVSLKTIRSGKTKSGKF